MLDDLDELGCCAHCLGTGYEIAVLSDVPKKVRLQRVNASGVIHGMRKRAAREEELYFPKQPFWADPRIIIPYII